jgi:hypothetical protein
MVATSLTVLPRSNSFVTFPRHLQLFAYKAVNAIDAILRPTEQNGRSIWGTAATKGMAARKLRVVSSPQPAAADPLQAFAIAISALRAVDHADAAPAENSASRQEDGFARRYIRTCSIARRRIEAIAVETERAAAAGMHALIAAQANPGPATIAAAKLLSDMVADAVRRMELLLPE